MEVMGWWMWVALFRYICAHNILVGFPASPNSLSQPSSLQTTNPPSSACIFYFTEEKEAIRWEPLYLPIWNILTNSDNLPPLHLWMPNGVLTTVNSTACKLEASKDFLKLLSCLLYHHLFPLYWIFPSAYKHLVIFIRKKSFCDSKFLSNYCPISLLLFTVNLRLIYTSCFHFLILLNSLKSEFFASPLHWKTTSQGPIQWLLYTKYSDRSKSYILFVTAFNRFDPTLLEEISSSLGFQKTMFIDCCSQSTFLAPFYFALRGATSKARFLGLALFFTHILDPCS